MSWAEWADAVEIEPSIYASDFSRLGEQLGALRRAGAKVFHFDVGDGHFIPEITIGPIVAASISPLMRGWGARLDCHLMVREPEKHFEAVAKAGGDSVTFHVEACDEPARARSLTRARSGSASASRSIPRRRSRTPSPRPTVPTSSSACRSIPATRARRSCPRRSIGSRAARGASGRCARSRWTAASTRETARAARDAGADLLVAGSAIFWNDDPAAAYREFAGLVRSPHVPDELLELREPKDAFERIEEWLSARASSPPGGRARRRPLPRLRAVAGDSPRRVAFAARAVYRAPARRLQDRGDAPGPSDTGSQGLLAIGEWERSWDSAEYRAAIEDVRQAIARGDVYQVNLVQHLGAPFEGDPHALADDSHRCARSIPRRS